MLGRPLQNNYWVIIVFIFCLNYCPQTVINTYISVQIQHRQLQTQIFLRRYNTDSYKHIYFCTNTTQTVANTDISAQIQHRQLHTQVFLYRYNTDSYIHRYFCKDTTQTVTNTDISAQI